jgi:hypothetical protein
MDQDGLIGKEALEAAFSRSHYGRDMQPGDVVGWDDGSLHGVRWMAGPI